MTAGGGASGAGTLSALLEDVRLKYGSLVPATVVAEAREPGSPLHSHFTWDEHANSEKYLLIRAAELIRRVQIRYVSPVDGEERSVRAYFPVRSGTVSAYVPTEEILSDPIQKALLLRQMKREWKEFEGRWKHMVEFADLIAGGGSGSVAI